MAADRSKMRHAHTFVAFLINQRHARYTRLIAGKPDAHFIEETAVDFVDDLQMPRQQPLEHRQSPCFQGLGQQRVVSVTESLHGDSPGRIPIQLPLVHQKAHQLRYTNGWMGIVQLYGEALGKTLHRHVSKIEDA